MLPAGPRAAYPRGMLHLLRSGRTWLILLAACTLIGLAEAA
jgi:hypothetical protein